MFFFFFTLWQQSIPSQTINPQNKNAVGLRYVRTRRCAAQFVKKKKRHGLSSCFARKLF
jgi:hypothetical protein